MEIHNLVQGSPEWHQFRLEHHGASEAPVMLGLSKHTTRIELLTMKQTGIAKEYDDWFQENVLDRGHASEEEARKIMEELLDEDLYPVTCSDGKQSASCDGLTLDRTKAFEHKEWNDALAEMVENHKVPDYHMPQLQQILKVTGAKQLFFVVSNGTREKFRYTIVKPSQLWFKKIDTGWTQFDEDLKSFKAPETKVMPEPAPVKELPMLMVEIKGEVTQSNLKDFKLSAEARLASVPRELKTDEDYVNGEAFVKASPEIESRLKLVKKTMQEQNADINEIYRVIDNFIEQFKRLRLSTQKLVDAEKDKRKKTFIDAARRTFKIHVDGIELRIKPIKLTTSEAAIMDATRNKKTLDSMEASVNAALANAMIAATTEGDAILEKLNWANDPEGGDITAYPQTFNDLQEIIQKPIDDFKLLVMHRKEEFDAVISSRESNKQKETDTKQEPVVKQTASKKSVSTKKPVPTNQTGIKIECLKFDDLTKEEQEQVSDCGGGKEFATTIKISHNGKTLFLHNDAMEPEDATFGRDLDWVVTAFRACYEIGKSEAKVDDAPF